MWQGDRADFEETRARESSGAAADMRNEENPRADREIGVPGKNPRAPCATGAAGKNAGSEDRPLHGQSREPARMPALPGGEYCRLLQGGGVDHETVFHVALEEAVVGFVDLLDGDALDVGGDVVLGAKIEHFLGFAKAADGGAGEAVAAEDEIEGVHGERLFGSADEGQGAVALEEREVGVEVVLGGDAVEDEIEAARVLQHFVGVFGDDDFVGAETLGVGGFVGRSGEEDDVRAEGMGELDAHVAESAEADDADFLAFANFPVTKGRIGGDAGAEQRSGGGEIEVRGDLQREIFIDHDAIGIAAVGDAGENFVFTVVGEGGAVFAEGFVAIEATGASAAGVDEAADGGDIAFLEFFDGAADFDDAADDLVARNHGINGGHDAFPLIANLMQIGVADAAEEDLDLNVLGTRIAARNGERSEGRGGGMGGVGFGGKGMRFGRSSGNRNLSCSFAHGVFLGVQTVIEPEGMAVCDILVLCESRNQGDHRVGWLILAHGYMKFL